MGQPGGDIFNDIINTMCFDGILTLWFLPSLFIAEMCFYAIEKRLRKNERLIAIALIVFLTCTFCRLRPFDDGAGVQFAIYRFCNIVNRAGIGCVFIFIGYFYAYVQWRMELNKKQKYREISLALITNIVLFRYNTVDLRSSTIGSPLLFYLNAITGVLVITSISQVISNRWGFQKLLSYLGKNSIIIFATHINLGIIKNAGRIAGWMLNNSSSLLFVILTRAFTFILIVIFELIIIEMINRFFRFIIFCPSIKKKNDCDG